MLLTICSACEMGEHDRHSKVIQAAPEGMIGGVGCRCEGECRDGRYVPVRFPHLREAIMQAAKARSGEGDQPEPPLRGTVGDASDGTSRGRNEP